MKTSCLTINETQVAAILPGLEAMMNAIGDARMGRFPRLDPRVQFSGGNGGSVYSQAESDETMAGHILTARNKLKWLNPSHKVRMNSFELAADAFALRLVQREELALEDVLAKVPGLADKLENYRKRAKRAAIKDIGPVAYKEQAERWGRFLQWMRCILCYRPTLWKSSALPVFHRDRRQMMLARATEVAPTADPALLLHLADLAKREVLRDRHPVTLGMLASNDTLGRDFMASFLLNRIDPELLTPEFQPLCILQAAREEQLKKALVFDEDDEPLDEVQVAGKVVEGQPTAIEVPAPSVESPAKAPDRPLAPITPPKPVPTQAEVAAHFAGWLLAEADPERWAEISKQTQFLAWNFTRNYVWNTGSRTIAEAIAEAKPRRTKPDYAVSLAIEIQRGEVPLTDYDIINFYAEWGARWVLGVNPAPTPACNAIAEGMRLVREQWAHLDISARQSKLDQIYRRYLL